MADTRTNRFAIVLGGFTVACSLGVTLVVLASRDVELSLGIGSLGVALAAYAAVGGLIASRAPRNPIGWLILTGTLVLAAPLLLTSVFVAFDLNAITALPRSLRRLAAWSFVLANPVAPTCLIVALLLFPDGRLANRWFRIPVALTLVGSALTLLYNVGNPETWVPSELGLFRGPAWARELPGAEGYQGAWGILILIAALTVPVSLAVRYRGAGEDERRPLRWLLRSLVALVCLTLLAVGVGVFGGLIGDAEWVWFAFLPIALAAAGIVLFGIPASLMVGVLTSREYDVDVVIRKTLVGGVMVGFVVATFILFALYLPLSIRGSAPLDLWAVVPAIVIAVGIGPLRRWARRRVDRVLYGDRATPYEVLSEFSERVGETYSIDDVMPRMVAVLGEATGAEAVTAWLRTGTSLRPVAEWPSGTEARVVTTVASDAAPKLEGEDVFEVRHQGESLGALALRMPASDPMNPSKERLAHDLAAQAGLVLRNIALLEDVRESRRRLVAAQDEERRRLERNIHDGAQQQLVALSVKLRLAEQMTERDPAGAARILADLQTDTTAALEDLRDLARGIYPPLLADKGLPAALTAQARKAAVPTRVQTDAIDRYPQDVEATIYFCCLEALNNTAKYAEASQSTIAVTRDDGHLVFTVTDDGRGFDPNSTGYGTGLQGMTDRLEAVGGTLAIESTGEGTRVTGRLPVV